MEQIKSDVVRLKELVNCDGIAIAGGEPLLYPGIVEVIHFITKNKMKSMLLTNGEKLTWDLAKDLKKAGLTKILIHVDSKQMRPGWEGKTEVEMNALRQRFADLIWELGGVHCGFHLTVYRSTLNEISEVVDWSRRNIHKVQHLSLIAFRGLPISQEFEYYANGKKVDLSHMRTSFADIREINISSDEIFEVFQKRFPDTHPSAYLNGTTAPETYKYLIILNLGSKNGIYGIVGAKTVELTQILYHLFKGRYSASSKNFHVRKRVFLLAPLDKELRKGLGKFLKTLLQNPLRLFDRVWVQTINIQQPREIQNGETNLCDGCLNQMLYKGKLISSCTLDEYRMFGGLVTAVHYPHS